MRNVSSPFGVAVAGKPNIVWVQLDRLDLKAGAAVRKLDLVKQPERIGDVSRQFKPVKPFVFLTPAMTGR